MNTEARTGDNLGGILRMVAAMALFAVEDMFIKFAAAWLPVGQIVFVSGMPSEAAGPGSGCCIRNRANR